MGYLGFFKVVKKIVSPLPIGGPKGPCGAKHLMYRTHIALLGAPFLSGYFTSSALQYWFPVRFTVLMY
jgi:hypothetical protein